MKTSDQPITKNIVTVGDEAYTAAMKAMIAEDNAWGNAAVDAITRSLTRAGR